VKIYVGQTRSRKLIARLAAFGWGEICCPNELPPRRKPWALDNGAYRAWQKGHRLDPRAFLAALQEIDEPPDFVVVPDLPADPRSLGYSLAWTDLIAWPAPAFLAVQDGMTFEVVKGVIHHFDGLFVGGSLEWKIATAEGWVNLAHDHGRPCHLGRAATPRKVAWARRIHADSIDGCGPLWSDYKLRKFIDAVEGRQQEIGL
jgi:hypothetical protein